MRLVILEDYNAASEWAAKYVRNKIHKFNPGPDNYFVLGLPTGKALFFYKLTTWFVLLAQPSMCPIHSACNCMVSFRWDSPRDVQKTDRISQGR